MKWHYQAKKLEEGDFVIVESFESEEGEPLGHTSEPVHLTGETKEELIEVLQMAIADIQRHDVLVTEQKARDTKKLLHEILLTRKITEK